MKQLVDEGRVGLIALDEAHLIIEWEHFRYVSFRYITYLMCCMNPA